MVSPSSTKITRLPLSLCRSLFHHSRNSPGFLLSLNLWVFSNLVRTDPRRVSVSGPSRFYLSPRSFHSTDTSTGSTTHMSFLHSSAVSHLTPEWGSGDLGWESLLLPQGSDKFFFFRLLVCLTGLPRLRPSLTVPTPSPPTPPRLHLVYNSLWTLFGLTAVRVLVPFYLRSSDVSRGLHPHLQ